MCTPLVKKDKGVVKWDMEPNERCTTINLLERTWKQTRNEIFKVHEMEQLY